MSSVDRLTEAVESIASRKEELFALLAELVSHPTVSPPARNSDAAQGVIANRLQAMGFEVDRWTVYPGDDNIVGRLSGSASSQTNSLIVNGHIDVAEVGDDTGWTYPPFTLTHGKDGRLYGRGVADMKGGLAASLFAIQMLREHGMELQGDLLFQSVIGEEAGEAGTLVAIERGYQADYAVVVDTSNLQMQGQGGVITGWITIESPTTLHDGMRAQTIHAGGRVRGASAIEKMTKVINALQELERDWAVMKSYPGFPPGSNTINPAVIEGGRHAAFIADRCALWITVHFYPNESYEEIIREIEDHVGRTAAADLWLRDNHPTFRWGGRSMIEERGEIFPSLELDTEHPGLATLQSAYESHMHQAPVVNMSPTVTDAGWFAHAGIPAVLFGPGELTYAHAVDESIDPDQLVHFAQIMARFIATWCNTPKEAKE
ncbi:acetylornithine deacetylase [Brevibacillus porteri]|uniref:Acetylornithine deacetylase n=1 Tax=Brevibacillus porteri TaxID=2126350 RepID=A0ABX5FXG2_9BACL|nr:acetylornithine deacetylase [Brevibacillus porteri]MED1798752.1 acetylornithine deacetylase [Brevibacillus porteri]MED2131435.1 acetylornithine deacetylase [Brevibacillus porteri]MED2743989.1 acetylornithine deacetylase [Brevibacillus porteri]MED2813718.1 acetylornithine deacetylase [Brevibacillus porteri]MED2896520.1 acetylornithine deacetylase [Brevibacillus porteri]